MGDPAGNAVSGTDGRRYTYVGNGSKPSTHRHKIVTSIYL
jgi:hypothetical protein